MENAIREQHSHQSKSLISFTSSYYLLCVLCTCTPMKRAGAKAFHWLSCDKYVYVKASKLSGGWWLCNYWTVNHISQKNTRSMLYLRILELAIVTSLFSATTSGKRRPAFSNALMRSETAFRLLTEPPRWDQAAPFEVTSTASLIDLRMSWEESNVYLQPPSFSRVKLKKFSTMAMVWHSCLLAENEENGQKWNFACFAFGLLSWGNAKTFSYIPSPLDLKERESELVLCTIFLQKICFSRLRNA